MTARSEAAFEALWKNVLHRWQEDAAHGAFLDYCQTTGQLAEAAARYRGMTGDRARGSSAERQLQAVHALALLSLEASRTTTRQAKGQAGNVVLIVLFLAGTLAVVAYMAVR